jgi:DNA-binding LacI/PurR family transcriptional regulator
MRTSITERHERIIELLGQRGQMRVSDLANELGVSAVTARRDVELLERHGALHRRHGVAYALDAGAAPAKPSGRARAEVRQGNGGRSSGPVVGMVVPSATYYYADVIRGARAAVGDVGGRLLIGLTNYDLAEEREQIRQLQSRGAKALLLTPAWPTGMAPEEEADRVATLGVPTVLVERRGQLGFRVDELDRVCSAHAHGGYLAVRRLASLGRQRIAVVARESPTAAQLQAGARSALRHLGVAEESQLVLTSPTTATPAEVEQALNRALDHVVEGRIDGALVHSDADAVQFLQLAQRRGLQVPEDVSLIAYDDEIAGLADPAITAVAPQKFAVGQAAARMALRRLAEMRRASAGLPLSPRHHIELLPELRVRESCGGDSLDVTTDTQIMIDRSMSVDPVIRSVSG